MALDEPNDSDEIFIVDGFTYLVDKQLLSAAQPITVDFNTIGFSITGNAANRNSQCRC